MNQNLYNSSGALWNDSARLQQWHGGLDTSGPCKWLVPRLRAYKFGLDKSWRYQPRWQCWHYTNTVDEERRVVLDSFWGFASVLQWPSHWLRNVYARKKYDPVRAVCLSVRRADQRGLHIWQAAGQVQQTPGSEPSQDGNDRFSVRLSFRPKSKNGTNSGPQKGRIMQHPRLTPRNMDLDFQAWFEAQSHCNVIKIFPTQDALLGISFIAQRKSGIDPI